MSPMPRQSVVSLRCFQSYFSVGSWLITLVQIGTNAMAGGQITYEFGN